MQVSLPIAALLSVAMMSGCGGDGEISSSQRLLSGAFTNTTVNAASANETISVAGYRSDYGITMENGVLTVVDKVGGNGTRTYTGTKLLKFYDRHITFDETGVGGQAFRLYQAAFDRKPDADGLGFWIDALENGNSIQSVASGFAGSEEFKRLYGANPTNFDLLTRFYQNVLHRTPDQDGFDWWLDALNKGIATPIQTLIDFSESAENRRNTGSALKAGVEYAPKWRQGQPIPLLRSSYENKMMAGEILGPQWNQRHDLSAYADFFQEGSYSRVVNTLDYYPSWDASKFGSIHFYRQINGQWVDQTSALLKDTTGCLHPRKAVVADFNGDRKPDVFLACHGYDRAPWPGEQSRMLLSQTDGSYRNVLMPITCYCHGASAVDYSGQGYADIVITGYGASREPVFLVNRRDGTFTVDKTRLPAIAHPDAVYSLELIDFTGSGTYDLWLGSGEFDPYHPLAASLLVKGDGTGSFTKDTPVKLPASREYDTPLDIVFKNGKIYLLRTNGNSGGEYGVSAYTKTAIQVIDYKTLAATMPYVHQGPYNGAEWDLWINWIIAYQGKIVAPYAWYDMALPE